MREIKVRVWDKEKKKMYYQLKKSPCFGLFEGDKAVSIEDVFFYETQLFIKMQYSELKDKNGREFSEGDIITWQDKPIFSDSEKSEKLKDIIVFEDGCFRTKIYNELLSNLARIEKTGFKFNYLAHHETEVIGNIYENPELLEGKE